MYTSFNHKLIQLSILNLTVTCMVCMCASKSGCLLPSWASMGSDQVHHKKIMDSCSRYPGWYSSRVAKFPNFQLVKA